MIKYFMILFILLLLICLFLPYVTSSYVSCIKCKELFSNDNDFNKSVMDQVSIITNSSITKRSDQLLEENKDLFKAPEPVYMPQSEPSFYAPVQNQQLQNQVTSELSPEVMALLSKEQLSQLSSMTPANNKPIELCKCDCDEMQKKIDDNCKNVKEQLKQCELNLEQQKTTCSSQSDTVLMQSVNTLKNTQDQINIQNEKNMSMKLELSTCTSKNSELSLSNSKLSKEIETMRQQILDIQNNILSAHNDTYKCHLNTENELNTLRNSINSTINNSRVIH